MHLYLQLNSFFFNKALLYRSDLETPNHTTAPDSKMKVILAAQDEHADIESCGERNREDFRLILQWDFVNTSNEFISYTLDVTILPRVLTPTDNTRSLRRMLHKVTWIWTIPNSDTKLFQTWSCSQHQLFNYIPVIKE